MIPTTPRPLRRSLLFVPGGDLSKMEKAPQSGADALILDLEDAVALDQKTRAREAVAKALREGAFGASEPIVRVNAPGTPYFQEDLEAVVGGGAHSVMVPKLESPGGVAEVGAALDYLEETLAAVHRGQTKLLALIESPGGISRAASLGGASPRLEALCFGHVDFSREMGLDSADASTGVAYHARCALAISARAAGVAPIDTVFLAVRDEQAFRADAALGMSLGFEGKLCIHPSQVKIVNELLTPTADQIAYARRVLDAATEARAAGRGVFTVDGKMIDSPVIAVQERILDRARRAGLI